jgi:large subunit ribosomal protein L5
VNRAKKAISNFKLRENNPIGVSLTLRGDRMWEFVDRLVNTALPRVRDFRGVNANAFDGRGNYALGLTEQLIFPEVSFDSVERVRGMQINVITTARTDEEGKRLLELLGMPFSRS